MNPLTAFLIGCLAGCGVGALTALIAVILNVKRNTP